MIIDRETSRPFCWEPLLRQYSMNDRTRGEERGAYPLVSPVRWGLGEDDSLRKLHAAELHRWRCSIPYAQDAGLDGSHLLPALGMVRVVDSAEEVSVSTFHLVPHRARGFVVVRGANDVEGIARSAGGTASRQLGRAARPLRHHDMAMHAMARHIAGDKSAAIKYLVLTSISRSQGTRSRPP